MDYAEIKFHKGQSMFTTSPIDSGNTAWLLTSAALVMLMIPGVAFFYGGMVRRKNVLSTLMMTFAILALIGILWVVYGYSLAFGPDRGGVIGGLEWLGLRSVGQEPSPVLNGKGLGGWIFSAFSRSRRRWKLMNS